MSFKRHFFVCQTRRAPGGKPACGNQASDRVLAVLTDALAARPDLWTEVAVTACACLGNCYDGPSVVVYPEAVWYARVTPDDALEIAERHLAGAQIVERLRHDWPKV